MPITLAGSFFFCSSVTPTKTITSSSLNNGAICIKSSHPFSSIQMLATPRITCLFPRSYLALISSASHIRKLSRFIPLCITWKLASFRKDCNISPFIHSDTGTIVILSLGMDVKAAFLSEKFCLERSMNQLVGNSLRCGQLLQCVFHLSQPA